jgi:hypothetical protein
MVTAFTDLYISELTARGYVPAPRAASLVTRVT